MGPTRIAEDALAHFQSRLASDLETTRQSMRDQLTIHSSAALVRWVAQRDGIAPETPGVTVKSSLLKSMASCAACLPDPTRLVVSSPTPTHTSWMGHVDIRLHLLVRQLLKRGYFSSRDDLRDQILAFIVSDNRTVATPIRWTSTWLT